MRVILVVVDRLDGMGRAILPSAAISRFEATNNGLALCSTSYNIDID